MRYDGTRWSAAVDIAGGRYLSSVSCPTTLFCAAIDVTGSRAIFFDGTNWTPSTSFPGAPYYRTVSCPSPAFCASVSYNGDFTRYTDASLPAAPANGMPPRSRGRLSQAAR